MAQTTDFEDVKAWDGVSGTGKDARGVLARNFQKIKNLFSSKADLVNGEVPSEQLPSLTPADGSVTPGKIASLVLEQDSDWITVFGGEGHWVFVDDEHAVNRPAGLPEPGTGETLEYNVITFGKSTKSRTSCMVVSADLDVYFLRLETDNTISVINVVDFTRLSQRLSLKADSNELAAKLSTPDQQIITQEDLDELTTPGIYSLNIEGVSGIAPSEFVLFVFLDGEGFLIQMRYDHSMKIWMRSMVSEDWSYWVNVGGDMSKKANLIDGKVPASELPTGLGVDDGSVVPGKIASLVLEQDPDWITVFGGEGHWVFVDDEHGMNRPEGLPEPGTGETLVYNIITFGMSEKSKPTCMVVSPDLEVYFLMLEEDNTISISNVVDISILVDQLLLKADVSYVNGKIGDIDAVLDILNGDVEGNIEEAINSMEGV